MGFGLLRGFGSCGAVTGAQEGKRVQDSLLALGFAF